MCEIKCSGNLTHKKMRLKDCYKWTGGIPSAGASSMDKSSLYTQSVKLL